VSSLCGCMKPKKIKYNNKHKGRCNVTSRTLGMVIIDVQNTNKGDKDNEDDK